MRALLVAVIDYFSNRARRSRWQVYASHAAFYVIVSGIPTLSLLLAFGGRFLPEDAGALFSPISAIVPERIRDLISSDLLPDLSESVPILSFAAVTLFWSASKGLRAISDGLRSIYGVPVDRSLFSGYLRAFFYTLVFILAILLALAVPVFGETVSGALKKIGSRYFDLSVVVTRFGRIVCFFLFTLVFAVMYKYMAAREIPLKKHLPGAVVSSLGWLVYSGLLSAYLRISRPEKYFLYGSVGALLLLMLWVRACMVMLMFGAEVNVLLCGAVPSDRP